MIRRPLIILDRDGVINHDSEYYIRSADEWTPIDGALAAIARLAREGFTVVVATNQAGVAKKVFSLDVLNEIHRKMMEAVEAVGGRIDHIFFCAHHPDDRCDCRKPAPGMLFQACSMFDVLPQQALFVGDSLRDLQAAQRAGCLPVLVLTGNGSKTRQQLEALDVDVPVYQSLNDMADAVLNGLLCPGGVA